MKKLMVVAAAVMLAGMTQAASFYWGTATNGAKLVDDNSVVQTSVTGGSIALVLLGSDTTTYSDATWLMDATFTTSGKASTNGRINNNFAFTWTDGEANVLDNGDVVAVLFKSDSGEYSKLVTADTGAEIDATYTISGITANTYSNYSSPWTFTTSNYQVAAVPEPTSGLLMLLGMAGLALRRRRA